MLWMASPPEVHSVLLSSGPGPGPLLAAAAAWNSLSAEYGSAADELNTLLADLHATSWAGVGAERYLAANAPYLTWLGQAGAASAAAATQHQIAADAHTAALAAMPTPAELAANHAAHATLVATNFFGVNTIPIALNEADYTRMWVQAATTMSVYQAASAAAVSAVPQTAPAPAVLTSSSAAEQPPAARNPLQGLLDALEPLLKSLGIEDSQVAHDPMVSNALTNAVAQILQNFGVNWNPGAGLLNGHVYDYYSNASQPIWYLARGLELFEDFLNIAQDPTQALRALQYVAALALFDWPTHIAQLTTTISQSPALIAAAAGVAVSPAGALSGLAGLAGLAELPQAVAGSPLPAAPHGWIPTGMATGFAAPTPATATPPSAPAAGTLPAPAPAPPPPAPAAAAAAGFFPPYLLGPPGIGFDSGMSASARSGAKRKTPAPDSAAAPNVAAARRPARSRRRRQRHTHYDEPAVMAIDVDPDWATATTAAEQGLGSMGGFSGTSRTKTAREAEGLAALTGNGFDPGPVTPLLPTSWPGSKPHEEPG